MSEAVRVALTLKVNGRTRRVSVPPMKRLLDVLREDLRLTGTKEGCGEGECGACTVLLDGRAVNSCLIPVVQMEGVRIVTVEGLAAGTTLTRLQQRFVEMGAAQCGICTPGMLMTARELIDRIAPRVPGDAEVREALAGNLCRCTGYQKIVDAVRAVARESRPAARAPRARKASARAKKATARAPRARTAAKRVARLKPRRTGAASKRKVRT